jgi:NAD(P)-dependent dehydrogenase (short-subunit alcohol dehydrogenase family)
MSKRRAQTLATITGVGVMDGKVAVVFGATSGIGSQIARTFGSEGASVVVAGRRDRQGNAVAAGIGSGASFVRADVRREEDVAAVVSAAVEAHGRIDCLVNNAGGPTQAHSVASVTPSSFDDAIAVHVRGALLAMKHVAPVMTRQRSGSIINTASINGTRAGMTGLLYSTAKAALIHLSRCVAVELGPARVRVNSLSPGPVPTGIFAKAFGVEEAAADAGADATREAVGAMARPWQPLDHPGSTADVAAAALFLASDAAAHITGHNLVVDGGILAGRPLDVMQREARALRDALDVGSG